MFVNKRFQTSLLMLGLGVLLVSCSITRVKWRIKTDKDMASGRSAYLDSPIALAKPERPPNIIVLLADDLGKYEVSAYGADHISTPDIDQIGAEGVKHSVFCKIQVPPIQSRRLDVVDLEWRIR